MATRTQERVATGATGAALVGAGGLLRQRGVEMAHRAVGKPEPSILRGKIKFKSAQLLKAPAKGKARVLYGAGSALGLAGVPALAVGITGHVPARRGRQSIFAKRDSANTFVGAGLQGTLDATKAKAKNTIEPHDAKATAIATGIGVGAGLAGSHAAHHAFNRRDLARAALKKAPSRLRPAGVSLAGATAGVLAYKPANAILHRHGYEVTPTGVKRTRRKPVNPTTKANVYEGRPSHGASMEQYRAMTVGKNDPGGSDVHVPTPIMSRNVQLKQIHARKRKMALDAAAGTLGATGVGLLVARRYHPLKAAKLERAAFHTTVAGGGVAAVNTGLGLRIQHRDIKAQEKALHEPTAKRWIEPFLPGMDEDTLDIHNVAHSLWIEKAAPVKHMLRDSPRGSLPSTKCGHRFAGPRVARSSVTSEPHEVTCKKCLTHMAFWGSVGKADHNTPLKTSISDDDAKRLVARHGLTGTLPKDLSREQRMAAYEARYVSSGGHKAAKWQHRATVADKVKNVGLAGATAGSALWTAGRIPGLRRAAKPALKLVGHPKVSHHAETAIGASAAVGGAGELYGGHARKKRSSYASAPGGVAASALRRMQGYQPT